MTAAYAIIDSSGVEVATPVYEVTWDMLRTPEHDRFTINPCRHEFERRDHPEWPEPGE